MGNKHTKIEGTYLPETPILNHVRNRENAKESQANKKTHKLLVETKFDDENVKSSLDPRSPGVCRTPVNLVQPGDGITSEQRECYLQETPVNLNERPLNVLKKRFFKGFIYNLNDPRSPQLNRTPMIFDDQTDKTLDLNDTFADLFVEAKAPNNATSEIVHTVATTDEIIKVEEYDSVQLLHQSSETYIIPPNEAFVTAPKEATVQETSVLQTTATSNSSIEFAELVDEETMACSVVLKQTPIALQQQFDPRSPTIGVERTPIILNDDMDEAAENAMLEDILATLSLNMSTSSSVSFSTPTGNCNDDSAENLPVMKPAKKPLDRVRTSKKRTCIPQPKSKTRSVRPRIYEDDENKMASTPRKSRTLKLQTDDSGKRTPLSCVKNRTPLRSRSVETFAKTLKPNLPLTSSEDVPLKPSDNAKALKQRSHNFGLD